MSTAKVTIETLRRLHEQLQPIVMVTATDYPTGRLADESGVDVVLVGDSLGMTVLGFEDTIPVTLEMMIHHTAAVRRGVQRAMLIADMPFMTYKVSPEEALRNAARLVQEAGAEAVKLEGGSEVAPTVRRIVDAGIPVCGHIGYTMQSKHALRGHVQGRSADQAESLIAGAHALEEAGCFLIVLEVMPSALAERITRELTIPTIGIGAGAASSGQVQVLADLTGMWFGREFKHTKAYVRAGETIRKAIESYADEVRRGVFPDESHSFSGESKE